MQQALRRFFSSASSSRLKTLLEKEIIPQRKQKFTALRKQHADKVIAQIKVDDAILGMRGLPIMFYDGSSLNPITGITFRGHSIPEFCKNAQKALNGVEPLPEVMFFLLVAGRYPTDQQLDNLSREWKHKGDLTKEQIYFITHLPKHYHPMTMLSMAVLNIQHHSKFSKAYSAGISKSKYWQLYYDDAISLLTRIPYIASTIYRHKYHNGELIKPDRSLDWAGNFAHMMGFNDFQMKEYMRGYLSIHADHQGGNVSAHTCMLVGSALSDPFLAYAAAINGLAGPLHGLANQQSVKWLNELKDFHKGESPNKKIIQKFVNKTLDQGRVIPGYGHAVLRNIDPRFVHLKKFAQSNIKNDQMIILADLCFETIPAVLGTIEKIKNSHPNVDAVSGPLFQYYGMKQFQFYTAVFAVSRSLGVLANGIWSRIFGLPLERPNSIDVTFIQGLGQQKEQV